MRPNNEERGNRSEREREKKRILSKGERRKIQVHPARSGKVKEIYAHPLTLLPSPASLTTVRHAGNDN